MIINDIPEPQKSLYVIGANILSAFSASGKNLISPLELFEFFKASQQGASISYFYFGLDWLFLANVVELDELGNIKLCNY